MRKLPIIMCLCAIVAMMATSCLNTDDTWKQYEGWRNANATWLQEQLAKKNSDGSAYYKEYTASWDSQAKVYVHFFNDTNLTRSKLSPLFTSTVDVKYIGRLYDNQTFDSSYLRTSPADSIFRTKLGSVITGWTIAIQNMHIGDTCEVLIPYAQAYKNASSGSYIKPYSNLKFNLKLVGIPGYEIKP